MKAFNTLLGLIISCLLLVLPTQASAWGQLGHKTVCSIAFDNMQPTIQREVKKLLKELPSSHRQAVNDFQKRSKRAKIGFAEACLWADAVRDMRGYEQFDTWHYVNVPRDGGFVGSGSCLKGCVLEAVGIHARVVRQSWNSWQRLQALMFLGHWVGDIHQPLHVGFADDKGGNLLPVRVGSDESNFHRLWDSGIIDWAMKLNNWTEEELIAHVAKVNTMGFDTSFGVNSAVLWAEESRDLAQAETTGYCQMKKEECRKPKGRPPYILSDAYYSQQWPNVRLRLKLAAERLAEAVDHSFK